MYDIQLVNYVPLNYMDGKKKYFFLNLMIAEIIDQVHAAYGRQQKSIQFEMGFAKRKYR